MTDQPAQPPRCRAPRDVEAWVFDLDNTLYPASCEVFPQIDLRMRQFIAEALTLPLDEAFRLQKQYYYEYGTSLRGLMLVHGIEPDAFLDYVHAIDHSVLEPSPRLDAALAALPGRKVIFTNGSVKHAEDVMARIGIGHHFEGIFDIAAADYIPKPEPETYHKMIRRHAIQAEAAAMVEDSHRNLVPAAELGMTTVWITGGEHFSHGPEDDMSHCHHVTEDLVTWLEEVSGE